MAYCVSGGIFDQSPWISAGPTAAFDQTAVVKIIQNGRLDGSTRINNGNPDRTIEQFPDRQVCPRRICAGLESQHPVVRARYPLYAGQL